MAYIFHHFEECMTDYGINYTGLFIDLNNCVACIGLHNTEPSCLQFGILPLNWKVGDPMTFELDVKIKCMDVIPNKKFQQTVIRDKLYHLIQKYKSNPDGFMKRMQMITKKPKEYHVAEYDELMRTDYVVMKEPKVSKLEEIRQKAAAIERAIHGTITYNGSHEQRAWNWKRNHQAAIDLQQECFEAMTDPRISRKDAAEIEKISNGLFERIVELERVKPY